ncbi:ANK ankyrin repeat protein [Rutstroemia sp. NJR-2017a BBW]|nr:ANK ankyrin repeat protein [Rutstroemia sp. NJR-2017a BBW]
MGSGKSILTLYLVEQIKTILAVATQADSTKVDIVPERWSILVLWEILRDIMLNPKTGILLLIMDAIDECESCFRGRFLTAIKQFLTQGLGPPSTVIKLLMSSRDNVDITEENEEYSRIICLDDTAKVKGVEHDRIS